MSKIFDLYPLCMLLRFRTETSMSVRLTFLWDILYISLSIIIHGGTHITVSCGVWRFELGLTFIFFDKVVP